MSADAVASWLALLAPHSHTRTVKLLGGEPLAP
jgi:hypothetical protein